MFCQNKLLLATRNHLTTFINGTYRISPVSSRCLREDPADVLLSDLLELVERLVVVLREDDVVAALSSFSTSSISLSFKSVNAGLFFTVGELTFPKRDKLNTQHFCTEYKTSHNLGVCVYLCRSDSGMLNHPRASNAFSRVSATRCWTPSRASPQTCRPRASRCSQRCLQQLRRQCPRL